MAFFVLRHRTWSSSVSWLLRFSFLLVSFPHFSTWCCSTYIYGASGRFGKGAVTFDFVPLCAWAYSDCAMVLFCRYLRKRLPFDFFFTGRGSVEHGAQRLIYCLGLALPKTDEKLMRTDEIDTDDARAYIIEFLLMLFLFTVRPRAPVVSSSSYQAPILCVAVVTLSCEPSLQMC